MGIYWQAFCKNTEDYTRLRIYEVRRISCLLLLFLLIILYHDAFCKYYKPTKRDTDIKFFFFLLYQTYYFCPEDSFNSISEDTSTHNIRKEEAFTRLFPDILYMCIEFLILYSLCCFISISNIYDVVYTPLL